MCASTLECNAPKPSNKPITVLYLIDTSISAPGGSLRGGTEKQLSLLVSSLNQEKFRPIVVQLSSDSSPTVTTSKIANPEILRLPTQRLYDLSGFRQIARLLLLVKKRKVDIIHTFFEKSEVMGWVAVRLSGIPVWITSRRDLGFKRKGIYDKIFRLTSRDCKKCIANCNAVRDQVIQQENIAPEKIEVIYNGLDLSECQQTFKNKSLMEYMKKLLSASAVILVVIGNL